MQDIYKGFKFGYSDYPVPMTLSIKEFEKRFFGSEGNNIEHSYIAYEDNEPIGLAFGGIRYFDNIKTMRCGTLCVGPEYRGKQISNQLMDLHFKEARQENCRQLFLEVIKTNERAINFYKKLGYYQVYSLKYYKINANFINLNYYEKYDIEEADFNEISEYRKSHKDIHINWQNEIASFADSKEHVFYIMKEKEKNIGYIAMSPTGKIEQLFIELEYRHKGAGSKLIEIAKNKLCVEAVSACFSSNSQFEGFLKKKGFEKLDIEQYEMYYTL